MELLCFYDRMSLPCKHDGDLHMESEPETLTVMLFAQLLTEVQHTCSCSGQAMICWSSSL